MRALALLIALAWTFSLPLQLCAWNECGHMTAALIAYRHLDDATRQKVAEILRAHPHYKLYLTADLPEGVNVEEWAFMKAAVWPDFVRPARPGSPEEKFKGPEITRFHRGEWHFVTLFWTPASERGNVDPTTLPARVEPNILTALDEQTKLLKSGATLEERAVALAWVEHLCGDIQQPLHACSMVSGQYPTGDRGGNSQAVRANGNVMNLHAVWDSAIGSSDAHGAIVFLADEITGDPRLSPHKLPELQKNRSFDSWAQESFDYAISMAYLNGRLKSAPMWQFDRQELTADAVPNLPSSYQQNVNALSQRRVALAGYRLAHQIKSAISN